MTNLLENSGDPWQEFSADNRAEPGIENYIEQWVSKPESNRLKFFNQSEPYKQLTTTK